jgi:hypothetical protein
MAYKIGVDEVDEHVDKPMRAAQASPRPGLAQPPGISELIDG